MSESFVISPSPSAPVRPASDNQPPTLRRPFAASTKSDNVSLEPERGNKRSYVLFRLKKSNHALFAKVVAGEM
jgi:hypothetical protein